MFLLLTFKVLISEAQEVVRTYYDEQKLKIREVYQKVNGVGEGSYRLYLSGWLKKDWMPVAFL